MGNGAESGYEFWHERRTPCAPHPSIHLHGFILQINNFTGESPLLVTFSVASPPRGEGDQPCSQEQYTALL